MNLTTQQDSSTSAEQGPPAASGEQAVPPRCNPILLQNSTDTAVYNSSDPQSAPYNSSVECTPVSSGAPRSPQSRRVNIYHMHPPLYDDSLTFYSKYDPATGIRTAAILGSCLFIVVFYGLYKTKCRKKEWTSQDRLFVEQYKKRFNGRKGRRGTDFAFMREPFHRSGETSVAMEQTAKWIQSQPLHGSVQKNNFKSTMGNLCMESFKATMYPVCDSNNINQMPNGKLKEQEQQDIARVNEIQRLNERNLKLDLQVTYKDMFPFKQNLWKSRSYDDKVNMQTISTLGSLCQQDCVVDDSITDCGLSHTDSCSVAAAAAVPGIRYPLSPHIVATHNAAAAAGAAASVSTTGVSSTLPMLQPLLCPPLPPSAPSSTTPHRHYPPSTVTAAQQDCLIPMIDDSEAAAAAAPVAAFHIGTPSSCSSLDHDECFTLTTTTSPQPPPPPLPPLTIIPPIPPFVPNKPLPPYQLPNNVMNEEDQKNVLSTTKL